MKSIIVHNRDAIINQRGSLGMERLLNGFLVEKKKVFFVNLTYSDEDKQSIIIMPFSARMYILGGKTFPSF